MNISGWFIKKYLEKIHYVFITKGEGSANRDKKGHESELLNPGFCMLHETLSTLILTLGES